MRNILEIFFKRRVVIIRIIVLLILVIIAGTYLTTSQYLSETRILIPVGREINSPVTNIVQPMLVYVNRSEQIQTQMEVLLNRRLVEDTLNLLPPEMLESQPPSGVVGHVKYYLAKLTIVPLRYVLETVGLVPKTTPRERLILACVDRLSVKRQNDSEILIVGFKHPSPQFAQAFLVKFLQAYELLRAQNSSAEISTPFYAGQEKTLRADLDQASQKLAKFREEWGLLDVNIQREQFVAEFTRLEGSINQTQADLVEAETGLANLETENGRRNPESYLPQAMRSDQGVLENLRSLAGLQSRDSRLGAEIGPDHPERQIVVREIRNLRETIYTEAVASLKSRANTTKVLLAELQRQRQDIMNRMMTLDAKALEMRSLQSEVDVLADALTKYGTNRETSRVSAAMDAEQINAIQIIEPPNWPIKPVAPKPLRDIALGTIFSVLLALCYAYLREHFSGTINSLENLAQIFPDKMAVALPELKERSQSESLFRQVFKSPRRIIAETPEDHRELSVEDLPETALTMLVRKFFYQGKRLHLPKTLLVVGSHPGVGAGTVARILGQYFAGSLNLKVLLVDSKTKVPTVREAGASESGSHRPSLSAWLEDRGRTLPAGAPGQLAVMPAGPGGPKVRSEFLKLGPADLDTLGDYDIIIFKAAPLSGDSVSFHLSSLVEATIVVARTEHTRKAVLNGVKADLDLSGANVLGTICNRRRFYIPQWLYGRLK